MGFRIAGPQIGATLAGDSFGLLAPPGADIGVMARQQDLGHRAAAPLLGPRVLGIFEQAGLEAFFVQ